ncbi:hypothetical protein BKA80DRAFT_21067 [Phyllosticta citrichinensis]
MMNRVECRLRWWSQVKPALKTSPLPNAAPLLFSSIRRPSIHHPTNHHLDVPQVYQVRLGLGMAQDHAHPSTRACPRSPRPTEALRPPPTYPSAQPEAALPRSALGLARSV